jgi:hypothetical protein
LNDAHQVASVAKVAIVQFKVGMLDVRVLVNVVNALGVKRTGTALDAMNNVAFFEQELGKVGTILASNTGDEGDFSGGFELGHRVADLKLIGLQGLVGAETAELRR